MEICTAGSLDMKFILDLYQEAFPKEERKPFSLIERKAAMGEMEILLLREEGRRVGLAITALSERIVLLDYFAVAKAYRGGGFGSEALQMLMALYDDRQFFLEIERTDDGDAPNRDERIRRKQFYLRSGMLETGIYIDLFGVGMELLAAKPGLTFDDCETLYRELLGPMYHNVVKLTV